MSAVNYTADVITLQVNDNSNHNAKFVVTLKHVRSIPPSEGAAL